MAAARCRRLGRERKLALQGERWKVDVARVDSVAGDVFASAT